MKGALRGLVLAGFFLACRPSNKADTVAAPQVAVKDPWAEMRPVILGPADKAAERVSLVRILVDPKALEGRSVAVGGYMHLEFEGDRFCLHEDDVEHGIITNCVRISVPKTPEVKALSDHYVWVEGVVSARTTGQMALLQAVIVDVKSIVVPPTRTDIEKYQLQQRRKQ